MKIPLIYLNHIEKERCYRNAFDKKLKLYFVNFVGKLSRSCSKLFCNYYKQWIEVYKRDAVREATMAKYQMTWKWVAKLVPQLKISELTRTAYQQLLNDYAKEHERQTTLDFHHQLKGDFFLPISAYYPGAGKQRCRSGNEDIVRSVTIIENAYADHF